MPKRSSRPPSDPNVAAHRVVARLTNTEDLLSPRPADDGKNPAAVALGRLGGKKGGKARAAKLTSEERSEIAKKAARARWKKAPKK